MHNATYIRIQPEDFDQGAEYAQLAQGNQAGAVVTFVGRVREFAASSGSDLFLEHYPGMTEKVLNQIAEEVRERWDVGEIRIIHRIGNLHPGEQIVFVGVNSAHRKAAFAACECLMDFLKTQAPFWKKEGAHWVTAKAEDQCAAAAWSQHEH